jgi:uncharacterized protein YjiS (DUF1127 family)
MWSNAHAPSYLPDRRRGASGIRYLIFVLDLALEVRRERQMLWRMDEGALKDIGFNRSEAYAEAKRWFWDLPSERLCP